MSSPLQDRLARWQARLADLPSLVLPTDYPRPTDASKTVEATQISVLPDRLALGLARLALYDDSEQAPALQEASEDIPQPATHFHLLLTAFIVLLHRFTGDNDLLVATSSLQSTSGEPLLLRIKLDPNDTFWEVVRRVQFLEKEAENDTVPYDKLVKTLGREPATGPLFRVRFFDEGDRDRAEKAFMEQTSSTSDMTIYVQSGVSEQSSTTPISSRTNLVPSISLRLHYNSLLFSHPRIQQVLEQINLILATVVARPLATIGTISLITPSQKAILPDPRADLEFCGWRGAITDIFSANAAKHPDQTCIIENIDAENLRTFTYKQIDEASNQLAHALLANGIEREDVITVYSTRNVDLVVAVLGIQKAGATFSVIGEAVLLIFGLALLICFDRPCVSASEAADLPPGSETTSLDSACSSRVASPASPRICYQRALNQSRDPGFAAPGRWQSSRFICPSVQR